MVNKELLLNLSQKAMFVVFDKFDGKTCIDISISQLQGKRFKKKFPCFQEWITFMNTEYLLGLKAATWNNSQVSADV